MHKSNWHIVLMVVLLGTLFSSGCNSVQRKVLVRSNPEGALVTVDHQPIGHTPVAFPVTYYGTREIQIEKDGYRTSKVKHRMSPPWYQIPPLDFISDNFLPREIRDDRVVDFDLIPQSSVDENFLLDRAGQLRGNAARGTVPMPIAQQNHPEATSQQASLPYSTTNDSDLIRGILNR